MSNLQALSVKVFFVQVTEPIVKQHKPKQASPPGLALLFTLTF